MPHRLNWAVYVCNECKEVFKRLQMLKRHQEKTGHTGMLKYTVSCNFGRSSAGDLQLSVRKGIAEESYE